MCCSRSRRAVVIRRRRAGDDLHEAGSRLILLVLTVQQLTVTAVGDRQCRRCESTSSAEVDHRRSRSTDRRHRSPPSAALGRPPSPSTVSSPHSLATDVTVDLPDTLADAVDLLTPTILPPSVSSSASLPLPPALPTLQAAIASVEPSPVPTTPSTVVATVGSSPAQPPPALQPVLCFADLAEVVRTTPSSEAHQEAQRLCQDHVVPFAPEFN